jgi:hypothetical protein
MTLFVRRLRIEFITDLSLVSVFASSLVFDGNVLEVFRYHIGAEIWVIRSSHRVIYRDGNQ